MRDFLAAIILYYCRDMSLTLIRYGELTNDEISVSEIFDKK